MHRKLFFVLLVLLPTQLGYHLWPPWSMVLGRNIDFLSPTLYVTDICIGFIVLTWLPQHVVRKKDLISQYSRYIPFILLVCTFAVLNIWYSRVPGVSIYAWAKVLEYALLAWYIRASGVSLSFVVLPLACAVLWSSTVAVVQFLLQHSTGGAMWLLGERTFFINTPAIARITLCNPLSFSCSLVLRAYGTFPHPNVLGGYLAVTLPLLTHAWLWGYARKHTPLLVGAIIVAIFALAVTFSRSAWVVGVCGMCVSVYARVHHRVRMQHVLLIVLSTVVLMLGFISAPVQDESLVVRGYLNQAGITLWKSAPGLGIGLGTFITQLPTVLSHTGVYILQPVHNIYILTLAETGLPGAVLLILLIMAVMRNVWYQIHQHAQWSDIKSPVLFAACSLLALGLVDHYPATLQQGQLLSVLLFGMALSNQS